MTFVTALTYHFCLALPAAFTPPGDPLLDEPCMYWFVPSGHYQIAKKASWKQWADVTEFGSLLKRREGTLLSFPLSDELHYFMLQIYLLILSDGLQPVVLMSLGTCNSTKWLDPKWIFQDMSKKKIMEDIIQNPSARHSAKIQSYQFIGDDFHQNK